MSARSATDFSPDRQVYDFASKKALPAVDFHIFLSEIQKAIYNPALPSKRTPPMPNPPHHPNRLTTPVAVANRQAGFSSTCGGLVVRGHRGRGRPVRERIVKARDPRGAGDEVCDVLPP